MNVAIATNDGDYVNRHFGRSDYFKIYHIENNQIVQVEMRPRNNSCCSTNSGDCHQKQESHSGCGCRDNAEKKQEEMASEISDCDTIIAGGMGKNSYESLKAQGFDGVLTKYSWTEEAITAFMENKIENYAQQLVH